MQRSVAGVAVDDQGRVLIGKRKAGGSLSRKWEFPGGKLERGEAVETGLQREFREELAVDIAVGSRLAAAEFAHKGVPFLLEAYAVTLLSHRLQLREHERVEWVDPNGLAAYDLAESDRRLLPDLLSGMPPTGSPFRVELHRSSE